MNKTLISTILAAGTLFAAGSAVQAAPAVVATGPDGYVVRMAPPPPVYESAPPAREGYAWAPGHYEWRGDRYVWQQGYWMDSRPGYVWREARWMQRPDGSWILMNGQWMRGDQVSYYREPGFETRHYGRNGDVDGDGVRNRDDRDRDGDGVVNRRDARPNDPTRN